jgi:hypothetical protein
MNDRNSKVMILEKNMVVLERPDLLVKPANRCVNAWSADHTVST